MMKFYNLKPTFKALILLSVLPSGITLAQQSNLPLNRDIHNLYEAPLHKLDADFHTAIKPYRMEQVNEAVNVDSINNTLYFNENPSQTLLYRKLRRESLFKVDNEKYKLQVDPTFNFEFGKDRGDNDSKQSFYWVNTRGFNISGKIMEKLSFQTSFYENQSNLFVGYLDNFVKAYEVIPGQGNTKFNQNDISGVITGYDYAYATGLISYSPNKYLNLQLGHDKTFIGDGYRSLFLSDNSSTYPALKLNAKVGRFQYMFMLAQMNNPMIRRNNKIPDLGYDKKGGVFHYLSYNVNRRLSLGFFESVVWQQTDTAGNNRGVELNYLNPVIFLRPVEFSQGSPDNASIGLSLNFKLTDDMHAYAQVYLDEFKLNEVLGKNGPGWYANKQAIQVGGKYYNVFGIKNLDGQSEINYVRPFTYSHFNSRSNYSHNSQALAHPLGTNFIESVSFLRYRIKSFFIETEFLYAIHATDSVGHNMGNDIFKSYEDPSHKYYNKITQGVRAQLLYQNLRLVYIVNPKNNFNVEVGISNRTEKTDDYTHNSQYVYIGFRTSLTNKYYDF